MTCVSRVGGVGRRAANARIRVSPLERLLRRPLASAAQIVLLLDYDGTLVPFTDTPEAAVPDEPLLLLLKSLTDLPGCHVHIVSGRSRSDLQRWFGHLGMSLWAEHGFWHRAIGQRHWHAAARMDVKWKGEVVALLRHACDLVSGSRVEEKTASIAWHYRLARLSRRSRRITEIRTMLQGTVGGTGLELIEGHKVIEVRPAGVSKALVAKSLGPCAGRVVLAFGDDRTDDDLFAALPPGSITVSVGAALPSGQCRVPGPHSVRAVLRRIVEWREGPRRAAPQTAASKPRTA